LFADLPVGEDALAAAGWVKSQVCDPSIGHKWTQRPNIKAKPLILYTTKAGQPSGVGVEVYGALPAPQQKWAYQATEDAHGQTSQEIRVAFRSGDILCSGNLSDRTLGDRLIVNPGATGGQESKALPMTDTEAFTGGWHRGSCGDGMGWHWWLDTKVGNNRMSWDAHNLFPVVTMYHEGEMNAILFTSWVVQQNLFGIHQWDPIPEPNKMMCVGLCDRDCTFKGTNLWSGMHVFFRDHKTVKCTGPEFKHDLECAMGSCCPKEVVV